MLQHSTGGMMLMGKLRSQREICPNPTLSTTNPMWIGLGLNQGLHGEGLVTKCLSQKLDLKKTAVICRGRFHFMRFLFAQFRFNVT
jgi:hypothetical protein